MPGTIRKTVTLYPEDYQAVKAFGEAHGLDFSSALRFVIRDWARMKGYHQEHEGEAEARSADVSSLPSSNGDGSGSGSQQGPARDVSSPGGAA